MGLFSVLCLIKYRILNINGSLSSLLHSWKSHWVKDMVLVLP